MSATNSHRAATRTDEQAFADSMDMALDRQARRAYMKKADLHWRKVAMAIEHVRGLVRQRMSEEDRRNTQ